MSRNIVLYVALSVGVGTSAVRAQTSWTYADCMAWAAEHNISLQKSRLAELNAGYILDESRAQWQPSVDFATSHSYTNMPWGTTGNKNAYNSSYGVNAAWTVWNGGQRENTIRQNSLNTRISAIDTGQLMRTIETDLLQVYLNILYARQSIGIYEEAAKVSLAQAERAYALMEAGKMSRVDYARLASQYEQDNYAMVNARSTYDTRRMELKQLLELGIDSDVIPADVDWDDEATLAMLPPLDDSYRLAVANDLELQSLELGVEVADLEVTIARAGYMPRLSLNAGIGTGYFAPGAAFGTQMRQGWNESVGLTLAIPILDNGKTRNAVGRARVARTSARLDIDSRMTSLAREVENWYIDTRAAQSRYTAALSQLESARLTDRLTNEQFALGYIDTIELMTAHNSYIEAQHALLQARFMAILGLKMIEYYRTTTITL